MMFLLLILINCLNSEYAFSLTIDVIESTCSRVDLQDFTDSYPRKVETDYRNNRLSGNYQPGGFDSDVNYIKPRCDSYMSYCSSRRGAKCFSMEDVCHKNLQCTSGKDEYKCDEALCFFTKETTTSLALPDTDLPINQIQSVDHKACAKICLDVPHCMGFEADDRNFRCALFKEEDMKARKVQDSTVDLYTLKSSGRKTCAANQFTCSYTECIPLKWLCDGNIDCSAGLDESTCGMASVSFQKANSTQLGYYHDFQRVRLSYGACAYLCSEDPDSCRGFWYSESSQRCYLTCSGASNCPTETGSLSSTNGYTFYNQGALSVMQSLKVSVQMLRHILSKYQKTPTALPTALPPLTASPDDSCAVGLQHYDFFPPLLSEVHSRCGRKPPIVSRPSLISTQILGGVKANKGDYPWQAHIVQARVSKSFKHVCGGTIITRRHILTAAHCMRQENDVSRYQIRVGVIDADDVNGSTYLIKSRKNHPRFRHDSANRQSNEYDISVVSTTEDIIFNENVLPACLPPPDFNVPVNTKCVATGFGLSETKDGGVSSNSDFLLAGFLNIKTPEFCFNQLRTPMPPERLCAGDAFASACEGDSGGPLVCSDKCKQERYTVYGIVHSGSERCDNLPTIFINVAKFVGFISEIVSEERPFTGRKK